MKSKVEDLERICKPIVKYLKNTDPYTSVIITGESIKVEQTQICIPVEKKTRVD